ncbi:MAG: lytic transglycosylase domain-containing protein [Pseudonocardiaceae bacterium]
MRWANEETWDSIINADAEQFGVPGDLVRAIIATESQFNPNAVRTEAGDQSSGLMQILYNTAKGEGYVGPVSGLLNPSVNLYYGTSYLAEQYQNARGDIQAAASAYNGGWRPDIGFGARATRSLTICLVRDSKGNCTKTRAVKVGEFSNQPYVDAVVANYGYFQGKVTGGSSSINLPFPPLTTISPKVIGLLVGLLVGFLGLRSRRG